MHHGGICMSSKKSISHADQIVRSLLRFGESEDLVSKNFTKISRRVNELKSIVEVDFRSRSIFPVYELSVKINSKYGDSMISIYGRQQMSPDGQLVLDKLIAMLETEYSFSFTGTNEYGGCS